MATNTTLLCIHQDPAELNLLQEHGYELLTATNGHEGLRLFMSQSVDAIVLDYQLGLLDGGVVAAAIKNVKPQVPIVMLTECMDIPVAALNSVDALVAKSDLAHSLLETVHSVLNGKAVHGHPVKLSAETPAHLDRVGRSWDGVERRRANLAHIAIDTKDVLFSPRVWRDILSGTVQF
ncbi:MAG: response regulator [Terriglobales bacterium]|jgi:DNA-binding response OmpR family regulator